MRMTQNVCRQSTKRPVYFRGFGDAESLGAAMPKMISDRIASERDQMRRSARQASRASMSAGLIKSVTRTSFFSMFIECPTHACVANCVVL